MLRGEPSTKSLVEGRGGRARESGGIVSLAGREWSSA